MLALLARPSRRADVSWSPLDPRWYSEIGGVRSDAGIAVVPENALGIAVVFRAINVLAHAVASIPLVVYRRLDNDGKERAREHPAYDLLHDKPNAWMTSFRWRHLAMVQKILWGAHYSEIFPGRGGIGQLVPLSPVTTRVADQLPDGRLLYTTRDVTKSGFGPERRLLQDDLVHVPGFSIDGKNGIPLPRLARNAMGLALAAEKHGSMFMRKGQRLAGILKSTATMTPETRKENEAAWQRAVGGPNGSGNTPVLSGLEFQQMQASNKDSQWLEARTFQVEELLRFLGVPGVLCGYADKTSTYASAEQFFLSFVTHTVRPETVSFAQELDRSVVTESPKFFADFVLEGLLKGDIKTRYSAHQLAIASGWKNRNEVRVAEDMNRGPDALDTFLEPLNMIQAGEERETDADPPPRPARNEPRRKDDDDAEEEDARRQQRLLAIAQRAASRLVRREVAAIAGSTGKLGAAKRFASDTNGWLSWLSEFYTEHHDLLESELGIPSRAAAEYCNGQRGRLTSGIPTDFESTSVAAMLALLEAP